MPDVRTNLYMSTYGLYAAARGCYESYKPEEIDDGEGNKSVIVDTILSGYGYSAQDVAFAIESLGGTVADCCEDCQAAGHFRIGDDDDDEGCEWLEETLEVVSDREADLINANLPPDAIGEFGFEWFDGAYVLMYRACAD